MALENPYKLLMRTYYVQIEKILLFEPNIKISYIFYRSFHVYIRNLPAGA